VTSGSELEHVPHHVRGVGRGLHR